MTKIPVTFSAIYLLLSAVRSAGGAPLALADVQFQRALFAPIYAAAVAAVHEHNWDADEIQLDIEYEPSIRPTLLEGLRVHSATIFRSRVSGRRVHARIATRALVGILRTIMPEDIDEMAEHVLDSTSSETCGEGNLIASLMCQLLKNIINIGPITGMGLRLAVGKIDDGDGRPRYELLVFQKYISSYTFLMHADNYLVLAMRAAIDELRLSCFAVLMPEDKYEPLVTGEEIIDQPACIEAVMTRDPLQAADFKQALTARLRKLRRMHAGRVGVYLTIRHVKWTTAASDMHYCATFVRLRADACRGVTNLEADDVLRLISYDMYSVSTPIWVPSEKDRDDYFGLTRS